MDEAEAPLLRQRSLNKGKVVVDIGASSSGHASQENDESNALRPAKYRASWTGIAAAFCLAFLVLLPFYLYDQLPFKLPSLREESQPPSIDWILHPEDHIHRAPTTQYLFWRITSDYRSTDGVRKRVYLVNDQFALPTVEARTGDRLVIEVQNDLAEGLSLHWHGLYLHDANEMDGAVGMTQCPIPPGSNFTYAFTLSEKQEGTFWWHAHDQAQRADGLYGGLIVYSSAEEGVLDGERFGYNEERLLLVGDWYHRPAHEVMSWYLRAGSFGNEPVPDSLLVNGLGAYNCSMAVPARPVECSMVSKEKRPWLGLDKSRAYRFRVVNVGSLAGITISVAGARLKAITIDGGHKIESEQAESVGILHPGERVDIVLTWPHSNSASLSELRIELDQQNFRYPNLALSPVHTFPILDVVASPVRSDLEAAVVSPKTFFDLATANASRMSQPFQLLNTSHMLLLYATTKKLASLHNVPYGFFNHTSWKPQQNPSLPLIALSRSQWDKNQFVPFIQSPREEPAVVDLIINNIDDGSHPFHLHGYDFYVLSNCADGTYYGSYSPYTDENPPCGLYNLDSPLRRDSISIPRRGYAVLRFLADSPGIWMLHCHMVWHQSSGLSMALHVSEGGDSETSVISEWSKERSGRLLETCKVNR